MFRFPFPSWPCFTLALLCVQLFAHAAHGSDGQIRVTERELFTQTQLAAKGRATAAIVVPLADPLLKKEAERIAAAARAKGVELPLVDDSVYRDIASLDRNLILLGDRDSNLAIHKLYYLHYTLLDAKYPGKGGSELRSLHNPFGDGYNILYVGGSTAAGIERASNELIAEIGSAKAQGGDLALGHLMRIHLGEGLEVPLLAKDGILWERRVGYGNEGHFGWNLISRNLALFYMTGEERFAKEFLRLAFPDADAVKELLAVDKEGFDDPSQPLVKPYHYDAIMMILYWDLVEEHPFFTPEVRQKVTEAFAKQFYYHRGGDYKVTRFTEPATVLGNRHVLWEGLSLYALARYFDTYYPHADTAEAKRLVANLFYPFNRNLAMTVGTLWWYNTFIEAAFVYAALSDPMAYQGNAVVDAYGQVLVRLVDLTKGDWASRFSSVFMLNLMAAMNRDQAYVQMIPTTGLDVRGFRIGQSYWPGKPYERNSLVENAGKVEFTKFDPQAMNWQSDFPKEEVVDLVTYRQQPDSGGDFLQLDTKYESGRNPFHNFALISLRLDGVPLLRGYGNQLHIYRDGLYASDVSQYTQLLDHVRVGDTVVVRGRINNQNANRWERTLLLRQGSFLLAVDRLEALADSSATQLYLDWSASSGVNARPLLNGEFQLTPQSAAAGKPRHYTLATSIPATLENVATTASLGSGRTISRFETMEPLAKGDSLSFATVLRPGAPDATLPSAAQAEDGLIALKLPQPALLSQSAEGGLVLREADHIFAMGVAAVEGLLSADAPILLDANLRSGRLTLYSEEPARVRLASGETIDVPAAEVTEITLSASLITALAAQRDGLEQTAVALLAARSADRVNAGAPVDSGTAVAPASGQFEPRVSGQPEAASTPALTREWEAQTGDFVSALVALGSQGQFAAAAGKEVLILSADGKVLRKIVAPDVVGALHWWAKEGLLLIGCRDETLLAVEPDGKERWRHTAQMAQELIDSQKFYWFKSVIPGVIALHTVALGDGTEALLVGGAGTVEVLNGGGELQKRFWQTWGAVDGFVTVPAAQGRGVSVLCKRSMGGWPMLFEVSYGPSGWTQKERWITHSLDGLDMGSMGFSMVGRNFLFVDRMSADGDLSMIGDFNGSLNRLVRWNMEGKPQQEVDLGPGFLASGVFNRNYGRSILRDLNVRGLVVEDLNADGVKEIAIALNRRCVVILNSDFEPVAFVRLNASPMLMQAVGRGQGASSLLAVGCFDGSVQVIDGQGRILATAQTDGVPTALLPLEGGFVIGTDKGQLAAFLLPAAQ